MPKKEQSFEKSLERIEEIIRLLESGDAELDKAVELYKEGVKLSLGCKKKLELAEAEVTLMTKSLDGFVESPFDAAE